MLPQMEKPPTLPNPKPPFGSAFYFALLLPLVLMAISAALVDKGDLFLPVLGFAGIAILVCSAFLAVQLSRRFSKTDEASIGVTIVMFLCVQGFYGICFFVGCTAVAVIG